MNDQLKAIVERHIDRIAAKGYTEKVEIPSTSYVGPWWLPTYEEFATMLGRRLALHVVSDPTRDRGVVGYTTKEDLKDVTIMIAEVTRRTIL